MKFLIVFFFASFILTISSGRTLAQTVDMKPLQLQSSPSPVQLSTITFRPPIIAKWTTQPLPGTGFTTGDKIAVAAVGLSVVALAIVLIHNHNRHHPTNKLSSLLEDRNLDVNLAFNSNLKGVGFRYAFK